MLQATTPEQRARYYEDIGNLISPGFLSHPILVGEVQFGLRSLGPGDLFLIKARCGSLNNDTWQNWVLATSLWMFNGYNMLGEKNVVPRMHQMVLGLPVSVRDILFSILLGLFSRLDRATDGLESFLYEKQSRNLWGMFGNQGLALSHGVPGATSLGTNYIQRIWIAFNEAEDARRISDQEWEGFKLVASSNSPKGVKKIDEADSKSRREELSRRQSVMDRYYYYRKGLVDRDGFIKGQGRDALGAKIEAPKTVEDLEGEFARWVAGDMDEHDQIVESYKQGILHMRATEQAEREDRRRRLLAQATSREESSLEPMPLVGYTAAQLEGLLSQKGRGPQTVRRIHDGEFQTHKRAVDKFIDSSQNQGQLVRGPDGKIYNPQGSSASDIQTLQKLVEDRHVETGVMPSGTSEDAQIDPRVFGGPVRGDD